MPDDFFTFDEGALEEVEQEEHPCVFDSDILTASLSEILPCDLNGKLRIIMFRVEADKDYSVGSQFNLCKIGGGQVRILGHLSSFNFEPKNLKGTLGWTKHKTRRREIVPFDGEGFDREFAKPLSTYKCDSMEGLFMVFTAEEPGKKGDYIEGYIIYVKL